MTKIIALFLAILMLCALSAADAEEAQEIPDVLGMTIGDIRNNLYNEIEMTVRSSDQFAFLLNLGGKHYRAVAFQDEATARLYNALDESNSQEAQDAYWESVNKIPITVFEELTAQPLSREELNALAGKTLGELEDDGWNTTHITIPATDGHKTAEYLKLPVKNPIGNREYDLMFMYDGSTSEDRAVYQMELGMFCYKFVPDMSCAEFMDYVRNTGDIWNVKLTPLNGSSFCGSFASLGLNPDGTIRNPVAE